MLLRFAPALIVLFFSTSSFSQNVGIGVVNPTLGRLQVNGSNGRTAAIFGGDGVGISLQRSFPGIGYNQYNLITPLVMGAGPSLLQNLNTSTGNMVFAYYSTSQGTNTSPSNLFGTMIIQNNGNVALQAAEATASLFVKPFGSPTRTTATFLGTKYRTSFMEHTTGSTNINGGIDLADVYINDDPALGNVYMGGGAVRVGINRSSPQALLEIGQIGFKGMILVNPNSFANWEFAVYKDGNLAAANLYLLYNGVYRGNFSHTNGYYYQLSDKRFKTAVKPLSSVLKQVMQLRPVAFDFIAAPGKQKNMGFIAQEVAAIFPELVTIIKDRSSGHKDIPDLHLLSYDEFGPIAIKAIQEQQEKIDAIREQNEALKKRLAVARKTLPSNSTKK
ncbi:MAG: tail fiber domain-containing protein [Bacteroidota bacterium]